MILTPTTDRQTTRPVYWGVLLVVLVSLPSLGGTAFADPLLDADLRRAAAQQAPAATRSPDEVDQLTAIARERLRGGQVGEAIAALDKAAGAANRAGATGRSFELSLTAAEALRQAGEAVEAARRYRHAALQNPRDPRAVIAHRTACDTLAPLVNKADDRFLDGYAKLLDEHLNTWPTSAANTTIRRRQAEVLARRKEWQALLDQIQAIEQASAAETATANTTRDNQLALLKIKAHAGLLRETPTIERFEAAQVDLHPLFLRGTPARWVDAWSPAAREAALTLATAALGRADDWTDYARSVLREATAAPPAPDPEWQRRAAGVQVVAALSVNQTAAADKALRSAGIDASTARTKLLQATARRYADAEGTAALVAEAERLAQSLSALANPEAATGAAGAAAMADAGRYEEALAIARSLAREKPNDRAAQLAYAKLVSESPSVENQQEALRRWRQIEDRESRATDAWYEARLARIELLAALGKADEAKKLAALTRLLAAPPAGSDAARTLDTL